MTNTVDQIINQAQTAAQDHSSNAAVDLSHQQVPMENQPVNAQVPAHLVSAPRTISMATASAANMSADDWLKFSFHGIAASETPRLLFDELTVEIDMTEGRGFKVCEMLRYGKDPVNYAHTYDGVTDNKGGNWNSLLQTAAQIDPTARPYPAAQIPMLILEDVDGGSGKNAKVVLTAGKTVGYTTPVTGWANWASFYEKVNEAGLLNTKVKVRVENDPQERKNYTWGVPKYTLIQD